MALSAFDLYSIGIGPSSSHTVGPMRAAKLFADGLLEAGPADRVAGVRAELFGSLGATGHGHGSVPAVVLGLEGEDPATVDTDRTGERVARAAAEGRLLLAGKLEVGYDADRDVVLHRRESLPGHPNGMRFRMERQRLGCRGRVRRPAFLHANEIMQPVLATERRRLPETRSLRWRSGAPGFPLQDLRYGNAEGLSQQCICQRSRKGCEGPERGAPGNDHRWVQ